MIKYQYKFVNGRLEENTTIWGAEELTGKPTEWRFVAKLSNISLLFEKIVEENESFTEDEIINGKKY